MANFPMGVVLFCASFLRESELFWRSEGGWPIWLRNLVEMAFYPLFVVLLGSVTLSVGWIVIGAPTRSRLGLLVWCILGGQILLMIGIIAVVLFNNVANLFSGRPIHSHTP